MRRPRDLDSELQTLDDKARHLRARKVVQLGDLVIACKADTLPVEMLAGALLDAAAMRDANQREVWRVHGEAFFQRQPRGAAATASNAGRDAGSNDGAASSSGVADQPS